jgi:hypothetical protein
MVLASAVMVNVFCAMFKVYCLVIPAYSTPTPNSAYPKEAKKTCSFNFQIPKIFITSVVENPPLKAIYLKGLLDIH